MEHIQTIESFLNESNATQLTDSQTKDFFKNSLSFEERNELVANDFIVYGQPKDDGNITIYKRNKEGYYAKKPLALLHAGVGSNKYDVDHELFMGNCSWKKDGKVIQYTLIKDYLNLKTSNLKKGCVQVRLISNSKEEQSIVAINPKRGIIYFLEDYDSETTPKFESKGIKLIYLNFVV